MCGPHESKQIAAMPIFLKLIECVFVESSELPNGTKIGKAFFNDNLNTGLCKCSATSNLIWFSTL